MIFGVFSYMKSFCFKMRRTILTYNPQYAVINLNINDKCPPISNAFEKKPFHFFSYTNYFVTLSVVEMWYANINNSPGRVLP